MIKKLGRAIASIPSLALVGGTIGVLYVAFRPTSTNDQFEREIAGLKRDLDKIEKFIREGK